VRLKPRCAGARILTLDGGGIRGIVELALLQSLDMTVGLGLPIRDLFDLVIGTSTGT
jgi:patatin-like phospholipase/acyl hydrolase